MRSCLSCRRRGIGEWCVFVFGPFVSSASPPDFVVRRKPGSVVFGFVLALRSYVSRRPTSRSCAFLSAFLADGSLSVLPASAPPLRRRAGAAWRSACARESNQERTHPRCRAGALRRFAAGGRGFADSPSMDCDKSASAGLPSVHPSPRHRGIRVKEMAWTVASQGQTSLKCLVCPLLGFCGQDGRALLLPGSLSAAARTGGKSPGARARCARVRCRHTDVPSANLRSVLAVVWARCPNDRGREGAFLLVTSLWASKEK